MKGKVAVIGGGFVGNAMLAQLHAQGIEVVEIDDLKKESESYIDPKSFEITKLPELKMPGEKEFKCKGIHEYREVREKKGNEIKVSWTCQCGKSL